MRRVRKIRKVCKKNINKICMFMSVILLILLVALLIYSDNKDKTRAQNIIKTYEQEIAKLQEEISSQ